MNIVSIRANSNGSRVNLELSDGRIFILLADDIVLLKLSKGQELDQSLFSKIITQTSTLLLRDYALRQVSISPKNKHILLPKLKLSLKTLIQKYSFPKDFDYQPIISHIISQLEEKKYLSDTEVGNSIIRKNSKKSPLMIRQLLLKSGLNPSDFSSLLPSQSSQNEEIKRQINKKISLPSDLKDRLFRQKIMASLFRKGFSLVNINRSIDEILQNR